MEIIMQERVTRLETQMGRIVSDIESEKRTRAEVNKFFMVRLDGIADRIGGIEKKIYMAAGAIGLISLAIQIYSALKK